MTNQYFSICGLFCIILLMIVFFFKKKINSIETKIYGIMLICSCIDVLLVMLEVSFGYMNLKSIPYGLLRILNKIDMIYYIFWPTLFFLYMFYITYKNKKKYIQLRNICCFLDIIFIVVEFLLPINIINDNGAMGVDGPATNFVLAIATIYFIVILIIILKNLKSIKLKKCIPYVALIMFMVLAIYLRNLSPTLIVIPAIMVYIDLIMFFTIENPDLKMIEELSKRKDINEKVNEDKANFLFHVTENVKKTIDNVENISNYALNQQSLEEKDESIRTIKYIVSNARIKVNETIDLSAMDSQNIKVMGNKYNFHNLVKEINLRTEKLIGENIEYRSYISSDIPDYLYGDSVKVKQILNTVLNNSIENTEKGFIELRVNSIQKYDICRLIITIEDSGKGMDIKTVNDILGYSKDLNEEELDKINELDLNLKMVKKLLQVIGGTLNIESNVGEGTIVTITINQKMIEEKNKNKEIEKYEKMIQNKKKVLVVIENEKNKKQIEKAISKYETKVSIVKSSQECLNRVRDGETYDYVFIQEDMSKINAKELVRKLNLENNFKSKVIVLREKQELEITRENIENVTDYLYFPIKKEDIKNILEKE